jgi:hypothetical protein
MNFSAVTLSDINSDYMTEPGLSHAAQGVKKYLWFRFPTDPIFSADPIIFSTRLTVRRYFLQVVAGCSYSVPKWRLLSN